jgi:hypothetical protein
MRTHGFLIWAINGLIGLLIFFIAGGAVRSTSCNVASRHGFRLVRVFCASFALHPLGAECLVARSANADRPQCSVLRTNEGTLGHFVNPWPLRLGMIIQTCECESSYNAAARPTELLSSDCLYLGVPVERVWSRKYIPVTFIRTTFEHKFEIQSRDSS